MSIFDRVISRLRDILGTVREEVHERVEEVRERIEERRAASLKEKLAELAKGTPYTNWENSSEDLVYVVGEDGSFDGRKELWTHFRMEGEYKGTAKQNIALHARFLAELPSQGIPWPKAGDSA
jgi:hypothetical protein